MKALTFRCPSCGARLAPIAAMDAATQIRRRTCQGCGEAWQLKVRAIGFNATRRFDAAEFTFLGHRGQSARARAFREAAPTPGDLDRILARLDARIPAAKKGGAR